MNDIIRELAEQTFYYGNWEGDGIYTGQLDLEKFAELIVRDCVNSEDLLGAIARGWCSKENEHKTMDSDLAVAIFDEVERQIKQHFGVK